MKSEKCSICFRVKGRRVCKLQDDSLICDVCCAKTRTAICEGCMYYSQAEKYQKEKQKSNKFIAVIDPEVDESVDQALAMIEKGKVRSGENLISELLNIYPNIHTVQFAMGVVRLIQSRYDEAISYFDKAIEIFPYYVEAWFNKAAAHQKRLELVETIKAYQQVVQLGDPSEDFVRQAQEFIRNMERQIKGQCGLSLDEYFKVKEIFDDAFAAMERMEWEKAIRGFQSVLSFDPNHTQSYGNLGICYAHLSRKEEALRALNKALELDPHYEPALLNRKIVSSLKDGETLASVQFKTVDYYKEHTMKNK
jgi:tetratricopeptide (TPR) repeat protein